ncbi:MAG: cell division protein ZapA [Endomicrobium sp.]|jgi:cell division protein ZapA|nr:cell division protein ZapA [Endomicrobium sp.]
MITIREKIMGKEIDLKIDSIDELGFKRIVNFVNDRWIEVKRENINIPDTQKISALTAIKIATELIKLRDLYNDISSNYDEKIKKLINQLNEVHHILL